MYYNKQANNVVAPTQQQRYFVYQQPAQYVYKQPAQYVYQQQQAQMRYQPQVQYIQQPVRYLQYQWPVQVQYPRPVQQYQGQYLQKPVYQNIQYKPVVQQRYPEAYHFQYPQQNVNKMTKDEIDEINRNISEVKMAMKQKRLRFAGDSKWLNNLQGIDDKGNLIMTSNPVKRNPIDDLMQPTYARLAEQEAVDELQGANEYKRKYIDTLPLADSFNLDTNTGMKYKLIARPQPNMAAYYAPAQNMINNVPVQKYVNYNGMYYYK